MHSARLFKLLVPHAPTHRRTDADAPLRPDLALRAKSSRFLLETLIEPGIQAPKLVSSYEGSIDRVLFAFPSYAVASPALAAGYRSVIGALRQGTRFVVVHHDEPKAIKEIRSWFEAAGHAPSAVQLVPLPAYVSFTDWAEDGYVALHDAKDGSPFLMEPWRFPRAGDSLIADAVAQYAGYGASQSPLIFQGGNCLVGSDFWLLGKDYFADSAELFTGERPPVEVPSGTTPEAFVRRVFKDYVDRERRLIVLGTKKPIPLRSYYGSKEDGCFFLDVAADGAGTYQPIFHIDMFVTLLGAGDDGRFRVLVGSPRLADQILGTRSPFALDAVYDSLSDDLAKQGFAVTRNPLVHRAQIGQELKLEVLQAEAAKLDGEELAPAVEELVAAGATKGDPVEIRSWHHITWNNCLVEVSAKQGNHVYLPTFGHGSYADLLPIDEAMRALWTGLGFTMSALTDFNAFAARQGVVHCIKKYLERGA
jgi:hypothetical protein